MKEKEPFKAKVSRIFDLSDEDWPVRLWHYFHKEISPELEWRKYYAEVEREISDKNAEYERIMRGEKEPEIYDPQRDRTWYLKREPTNKQITKMRKLIFEKGWTLEKALRKFDLIKR